MEWPVRVHQTHGRGRGGGRVNIVWAEGVREWDGVGDGLETDREGIEEPRI